MARKSQQGSDTPPRGPHTDDDEQPILAEFDLLSVPCLIRPEDAPAKHPPAADDVLTLGHLELDGHRYTVCAKPTPLRHEPVEDPTCLLTARELQIVRLVCFGKVNKQIADQLKISEYTVKTYLRQIFMKLKVRSRSAMVYRCARWVGA